MDWESLYDDSYKEESDSKTLQSKLERLEFEERYQEKAFLNEGAMKQIYTCKDLSTGREVAYAIPKSTELAHSESFLREANISASLQHPNIIPIYDIGLCDDKPYFTMKMIHGRNLSDIIFKSSDTPPLSSLLNIFYQGL